MQEVALRCARRFKIMPYLNRPLAKPTDDVEEIERLWTQYPEASIGVDLKVNNICQMTVSPSCGVKSLGELFREYGPLPRTVQSRTWDNYQNYYFENYPKRFVKLASDTTYPWHNGEMYMPSRFTGIEVFNSGIIVLYSTPREKLSIWEKGQALGGHALAKVPEFLIRGNPDEDTFDEVF